MVGCSDNPSKDFDILIRNGRIVDGNGNPSFQGDVGIVDDTIVEIWNLTGRGALETIDAASLVVSPGFIDVHTHADGDLGRPGSNANLNYLNQGVTTVVTGNCGSGTFEIAKTKAEWEAQGIGTNTVHLVGFGDIRRAVMGTDPREPEVEELETDAVDPSPGDEGRRLGHEHRPRICSRPLSHNRGNHRRCKSRC